jgi:hypothetical protein
VLNLLPRKLTWRLNSADEYTNKILTVLDTWKEWGIFEDKYITGLSSCLLKKKRSRDEIDSQLSASVKAKLEEYEDSLLEHYSENEGNIILIAKECGVSTKGRVNDIISRLVQFKEFRIIGAAVSFRFYNRKP